MKGKLEEFKYPWRELLCDDVKVKITKATCT